MHAQIQPVTPLKPVLAPRRSPGLGKLTHLARLEAESIHIFREVAAEFAKPLLMYSIGKDSSVLLHLARKAFFPGRIPFPLLHIDTGWKFKEMIAFRDETAKKLNAELIVHTNEAGRAAGVTPFTHGARYTDIMKTEALKAALDKYGCESRAKERVFSFRDAQHRWDPKNQRPELWNLYNGRLRRGDSIRVFPLSNWTEIDIWTYIHAENIPVVPLYFAKPRPIVERDGLKIMVDDDRLPLKPGEKPHLETVRFRSLGCYPLTGAQVSKAANVPEIIEEMLRTTTSERQSRAIDAESAAAMENRKREGYF
jgi:sulfate adenylyltransferase subunit 2